MKQQRLIIVTAAIAVCAFVACTGPAEQEGAAGDEAATPSGATESGAAGLVSGAVEKAADPNVQGCISQVAAGAYKDALPLCMKAAEIAPDDPEVAKALETAKAKAAGDVAGMQGAAEDAKKQVEGMKPALP